jgi:hypothetical protein
VGFIMNLICISMTVLWMNTIAYFMFDLDPPFPDWITESGKQDHCFGNTTAIAN